MCSSGGEAMFPHATPVGWLSEHCTVLISLPALGMELGLHPQNRCSLIVHLYRSLCLFFLSNSYLLWPSLSSLFPHFPLWCSDVKTGLKLSNLESEIRAGGGYYLWVDSDWIGSRGSNTPKWQLGRNPGPIYLTWRSLERRACNAGWEYAHAMMKCTIAELEGMAGRKTKGCNGLHHSWVNADELDHVSFIYV